ncbi:hypothetical protein R0J91_21070, partial [Micrococcus sp. SIMBA_131]
AEEKTRREEAIVDEAAQEQAQGKKPAYEMPPLKYADSDSARMGDASQQDDKVLIDRAEYNRLLEDSAMLEALKAAGVDN